MKIAVTILFFTFCGYAASAQTKDKNTVTQNERSTNEDTEIDQDTKQDKKGIGDLLNTLGEGFLDRLKYRFNLGGLENKFEDASHRFENKESAKEASTSSPPK